MILKMKYNIRLSEVKQQEIVEYYKLNNISLKDIGKKFNLCGITIRRILLNHNIKAEYIRKGKYNSKWRGGKTVSKDGRVLIHSPNHPNPNWKNYVYRYRLVMEKHLGRYLNKKEIIHHKNCDPSDDRLKNLEITTQINHCREHMKQRYKGKYPKEKQCNKCNKTFFIVSYKIKNRKLCKTCSNRK